MNPFCGIILTYFTYISSVKADLPVHVLLKDIGGKWRFYISKQVTGSNITCGSGFPNTLEANLAFGDYSKYLRKHYGIAKVLDLNLSFELIPYDTQVDSRKDWKALAVRDKMNNLIGRWTLVYDQGFEIILYNGTRMFYYINFIKVDKDQFETIPYKTNIGWAFEELGNKHYCTSGTRLDRITRSNFTKVTLDASRSSMRLINPFQRHIYNGSYTLKAAKFNPTTAKLGIYPCVCKREESDQMITKLPKSFTFKESVGIPVSNQGSCGSCFSIAAMHVIMAKLERLGVSVNLDINGFVCDFINQGCKGGYPYLIGKLAKEFGISTAKSSNARACTMDLKSVSAYASDYGYVGGCYQCTGCNGEELIMNEIYNNGPVVAALDASVIPNNYSGGVLTFDKLTISHSGICDVLNGYLGGWEFTSHAVVIYGWGEEIVNGESVKYWIIRNSWGNQWGIDGDFKMIRGVNALGIESEAVYIDVYVPHVGNTKFVDALER